MARQSKQSKKESSLVEQLVKVLKAKKNLILQGAPGTGKTYLAKRIAQSMIGKDYKSSEQFKIVQFHPSYTYEDFVRGIVATTNDDGKITYTPEDKLLAKFASKANANFEDSNKEPVAIHQLKWSREKWENYKDTLRTDMQNGAVTLGNYALNAINDNNIQIGTYSLPDNLVIDSYIAKEINKDNTYTPKYYAKAIWTVVKKFAEHLANIKEVYKIPDGTPTEKIELKNYILIIDEINRANLPTVLGELLYTLEYRKEKVDTTNEVEGDCSLVLPPNLYIIGTMNTADRSVGHIDYAIRRRFAFEYIMSKDLSAEKLDDGCRFQKNLFEKVQELFDEWLFEGFDKRDVAIGHSYFITNEAPEKGMTKDMRIKYEIRPLLEEYVKDGILKKELNGDTIEQKLNEILK